MDIFNFFVPAANLFALWIVLETLLKPAESED